MDKFAIKKSYLWITRKKKFQKKPKKFLEKNNEVALSRSAYSLRPLPTVALATLRTGAPAPDLRPQGYAPNPKKLKKEKLILSHLEAVFDFTSHDRITLWFK